MSLQHDIKAVCGENSSTFSILTSDRESATKVEDIELTDLETSFSILTSDRESATIII